MCDSESEDGGLVFRARALNPSGDVFGLRARKSVGEADRSHCSGDPGAGSTADVTDREVLAGWGCVISALPNRRVKGEKYHAFYSGLEPFNHSVCLYQCGVGAALAAPSHR